MKKDFVIKCFAKSPRPNTGSVPEYFRFSFHQQVCSNYKEKKISLMNV